MKNKTKAVLGCVVGAAILVDTIRMHVKRATERAYHKGFDDAYTVYYRNLTDLQRDYEDMVNKIFEDKKGT